MPSRMVRTKPLAVKDSSSPCISSFTCKSRHARCDEKKPICSNCKRLNLQCRASEFIAPSAWCTAIEPPLGRQRTDHRDGPPVEPPASTWDVFNTGVPGPSSSDSSKTSPSLSQRSVLFMPSPRVQSAASATVPLTAEVAYLLHIYQSGVATWMDLFDHSCTYQRVVPQRMLSSELLLYCVCAFTSKHLSLLVSGEIWTPVAGRYYGEALHMLIELLGSTASQDDALTATILLSSYEMIAAQGQEHRRHFYGALMLIKTHGICARSGGLDKANFWIYIRHEIVVALMTESKLLLSPEEWNVNFQEDETQEDLLGNQLLWLLAKVINLVYEKDTNTGKSVVVMSERMDLMKDVEKWFDGLPTSFQGVKYGEVTGEGFSRLYFAIPAAANAMMYYHLLHILLYAEPHPQDQSQSLQVQYHATQIASIAISHLPDSVRSFSQQALFYAAKHVHGLAKKARIWTVMDDVELRLGFHTRSRVKKLQELVETAL